jgi:hypothetical protein
VWPSTTKISLPCGVINMVPSALIALIGLRAATRRRA